MTTAEAWEPGVPLYERSAYRDVAFNFRDDPESEECHCADAAGWPNPNNGRGLPPGDELGDFIAAWHRWRRESGAA